MYSSGAPKEDDGKLLGFRMSNGKDVFNSAEHEKIVEFRKKGGDKYTALLGNNKFFGGEKPCIGDFWVATSYLSMERNPEVKT